MGSVNTISVITDYEYNWKVTRLHHKTLGSGCSSINKSSG